MKIMFKTAAALSLLGLALTGCGSGEDTTNSQSGISQEQQEANESVKETAEQLESEGGKSAALDDITAPDEETQAEGVGDATGAVVGHPDSGEIKDFVKLVEVGSSGGVTVSTNLVEDGEPSAEKYAVNVCETTVSLVRDANGQPSEVVVNDAEGKAAATNLVDGELLEDCAS